MLIFDYAGSARGPDPLPSNRSFGVLFAVVFGGLGGWSLWRSGTLAPYLFLAATLFAVLAWRAPEKLASLNRGWMRFGALLHRIVSPIVLGIMYFCLITPYALVMRVAGRDPLCRRLNPNARSYWIDRTPPGPPPGSLGNQF